VDNDDDFIPEDDTDDIRRVAEDYVTRMGAGAVEYLREREKVDRERGDDLSAEAWRDILAAAEKILARRV
jgi:hypothetical protein